MHFRKKETKLWSNVILNYSKSLTFTFWTARKKEDFSLETIISTKQFFLFCCSPPQHPGERFCTSLYLQTRKQSNTLSLGVEDLMGDCRWFHRWGNLWLCGCGWMAVSGCLGHSWDSPGPTTLPSESNPRSEGLGGKLTVSDFISQQAAAGPRSRAGV